MGTTLDHASPRRSRGTRRPGRRADRRRRCRRASSGRGAGERIRMIGAEGAEPDGRGDEVRQAHRRAVVSRGHVVAELVNSENRHQRERRTVAGQEPGGRRRCARASNFRRPAKREPGERRTGTSTTNRSTFTPIRRARRLGKRTPAPPPCRPPGAGTSCSRRAGNGRSRARGAARGSIVSTPRKHDNAAAHLPVAHDQDSSTFRRSCSSVTSTSSGGGTADRRRGASGPQAHALRLPAICARSRLARRPARPPGRSRPATPRAPSRGSIRARALRTGPLRDRAAGAAAARARVRSARAGRRRSARPAGRQDNRPARPDRSR